MSKERRLNLRYQFLCALTYNRFIFSTGNFNLHNHHKFMIRNGFSYFSLFFIQAAIDLKKIISIAFRNPGDKFCSRCFSPSSLKDKNIFNFLKDFKSNTQILRCVTLRANLFSSLLITVLKLEKNHFIQSSI